MATAAFCDGRNWQFRALPCSERRKHPDSDGRKPERSSHLSHLQQSLAPRITCQHSPPAVSTEDFTVWHKRLGHLSSLLLSKLRKMIEDPQHLPTSAEKQKCKDCLLAKSTKLPKTTPGSKTHAPLELIHSDLSGKFSIEARGGFLYYISFIDDFSRYTHLYLLKTKYGHSQRSSNT